MTHNRIIINEEKSTYHWNNDSAADIKTRGRLLKQQGEGGFFTYLGWTTNMKLDWSVQVNQCIEKFTRTTNFIMSERGITINQRIQLVNIMAQTSILYRTRIMLVRKNIWLEELDKWVIKTLNKRSNSSRDTHAAYWFKFRGLKLLSVEGTASYFGHGIDRILNDKKTEPANKAISYLRLKKEAKVLQMQIVDESKNKIKEMEGIDKPTWKTLQKFGIILLWRNSGYIHSNQLTINSKAMTAGQIDKLNMDAPKTPLDTTDG